MDMDMDMDCEKNDEQSNYVHTRVFPSPRLIRRRLHSGNRCIMTKQDKHGLSGRRCLIHGRVEERRVGAAR